MKITFSRSALGDLESIQSFYKDEGAPEVGKKFVMSIIEHIETLRNHPEIGRIVPEFNELKIRELIHSPFRVVYLREEKTLHMVRIWRSERLLELPEGDSEPG